jgi:CHASE2 domain-containing sensor protein
MEETGPRHRREWVYLVALCVATFGVVAASLIDYSLWLRAVAIGVAVAGYGVALLMSMNSRRAQR